MMPNCDKNRSLKPDSQRKRTFSFQLLGVSVAVWLCSSPQALAQLEPPTAVWNDTTTGIAIANFDPVSYFGPGGPVPGLEAFEYKTPDAVWRFANEGNYLAFRDNHLRYIPQFGGYGAFGMAVGRVVEPNPTIWHIEDNRLYLFHSSAAKASWLKNAFSLKALADEQWAKILAKVILARPKSLATPK